MFNSQVKTVAEFILEKGNPYKMLALNLYNFVVGTTIPSTATNKILSCYIHGKDQYEISRTQRFLDQSKKLFDMIHKIAFPKPVDASKKSSTSNVPSNELNVKEVTEAQKLIDIARSRGITMSEILQYNLLTNNSLFEEQVPSKPDKHKIVTKLENILQIKNDFESLDDTNNVLVVDVMSLLRHLLMKNFQDFQELLGAGWNYVNSVCKFNELHIVFDSYIADSLKECERERRSTCDPLHFDSLTPSTKVSSRPERFWVCGKNKEKLQRLSQTFFINVSRDMDISVILSGFVAFDGKINNSFKVQRENSMIQQDLTSAIEEADIHVIPHVSQAVKEKSSNIVMLSNDADVVLVLYYIEKFVRECLQKLWIRYSTRDHTRYLPIHILYEKLGASFCFVLLNAHILTGCDMTSDVGTKEKAIKVKPDKFLHAFSSTDEINFL